MDTKKYEKILEEVEDIKNELDAKSNTLNEVMWRMRNAISTIKDYIDEIKEMNANPDDTTPRRIKEHEAFIESNEKMLNAYARIAKSINKA